MAVYVGFGLTIENTASPSESPSPAASAFEDLMRPLIADMTKEVAKASKQHWKDNPPTLWGRIKKVLR